MIKQGDTAHPSRRAMMSALITAPVALASVAMARTLSGDQSNTVDLFDFIPQALHTGIRKRKVDNSLSKAVALAGYIQNAIDASVAERRHLVIPAGLYNIAPTGTFAAEAGQCRRCFSIRSHMTIKAQAGASFRIVNDVSTDAAPVFMCMFGTNENLREVAWHGLEMDMNGANNKISPNRGTPSLPYNGYSLVNQAQIYVTGTPEPRAAARISNATIDRCRLINTPGVSCIVMGQSNTVGSGLGSGWTVRNCIFHNNGFDTVDHSSIYGWAENVMVTDNEFSNNVPFNVTGGFVAYEVHGTNTTFARNRVTNYYQGMWLDGNGTREVRNTQVLDNVFDSIAAFGIMFFAQSANATSVTNSLIQGNTIVLDDTNVGTTDLKFGIGAVGKYSVTDVKVRDNLIRGIGTSWGKAGIAVVAGDVAGQKHDRWLIENNTIRECTLGIATGTNAAAGLGTIEIRGNKAVNLMPMGAFQVPQGISYTGTGRVIDRLILRSNLCLDDRKVPRCAFGIRLQGPIDVLDLQENVASRMVLASYARIP